MAHTLKKFVSSENRRWRTAVIFEIEKLPHLGKGLTNRHKIRHNDKLASLTIWPIVAITVLITENYMRPVANFVMINQTV